MVYYMMGCIHGYLSVIIKFSWFARLHRYSCIWITGTVMCFITQVSAMLVAGHVFIVFFLPLVSCIYCVEVSCLFFIIAIHVLLLIICTVMFGGSAGRRVGFDIFQQIVIFTFTYLFYF